jgi:hypothetical protein
MLETGTLNGGRVKGVFIILIISLLVIKYLAYELFLQQGQF